MYTFLEDEEPFYYVVKDNKTFQEEHFEKIKAILCIGFCHKHEKDQSIIIPDTVINLVVLFTYCKYFLEEKKTHC